MKNQFAQIAPVRYPKGTEFRNTSDGKTYAIHDYKKDCVEIICKDCSTKSAPALMTVKEFNRMLDFAIFIPYAR